MKGSLEEWSENFFPRLDALVSLMDSAEDAFELITTESSTESCPPLPIDKTPYFPRPDLSDCTLLQALKKCFPYQTFDIAWMRKVYSCILSRAKCDASTAKIFVTESAKAFLKYCDDHETAEVFIINFLEYPHYTLN